MSDALKSLIAAAVDRPLSRTEAETAFRVLFEGEATPSQIGGLLMTLRTRGETVEEYAAAAAVMRAKCKAVRAPDGAMDIVGTGGDGKGTLNISTATAFVVAGAASVLLVARSATADIYDLFFGGEFVANVAELADGINIHLPLGSGPHRPDIIAVMRDVMQNART